VPVGGDEVIEETIAVGEVRRRAAAGAALLAGRGAALQLLAFGAGIVLARLLVPHDFGLVALGTTIMYFGSLMANYGLGSALIRRPEALERDDLAAVVGFQLVLTGALAALVASSAAFFGRAGLLAAVMVASLPITAFRSPGAIALERRLSYRPLIAVEVLENGVYYGWAIATVVAGWGVWGLATAVAQP
jgi:O-antigen/teichoic acid export membrane protein